MSIQELPWTSLVYISLLVSAWTFSVSLNLFLWCIFYCSVPLRRERRSRDKNLGYSRRHLLLSASALVRRRNIVYSRSVSIDDYKWSFLCRINGSIWETQEWPKWYMRTFLYCDKEISNDICILYSCIIISDMLFLMCRGNTVKVKLMQP